MQASVPVSLDLAWREAGKPEGALNRWLAKLGTAALRAPAAASAQKARMEAAEEGCLEDELQRHRQQDPGQDKKIHCKFPPHSLHMLVVSCVPVAGHTSVSLTTVISCLGLGVLWVGW